MLKKPGLELASNDYHPIGYRPELDGLRAVAVLAVILFHAGVPFLSGGFLGVDVFLVLSGYLITLILLAESERPRGLAFFYERRIRRLAPAFGVVLVTSTVAAWWLLPTAPMRDFGRTLMAAAVSGANVLFWRTSGYFALTVGERPLIHLWSLSVEEQFYLFYPLLLLWAARRGRLSVHAAVLVGMALSFAMSLSQWDTRPELTFYLLPTRAWELLAGAGVALLPANRVERLGDALRDSLGWFAFLVLFACLALVEPSRTLSPWSQVAVVLATAILIFVPGSKGRVTWLLRRPPLVGIGLVSYSAYLWHQPLFDFARMALLEPPNAALMAGLVILTFVLAAITWRWVERPARRPVPGQRRLVFSAAATGAAACILTGLVLTLPSVQAWRVGPAVQEVEAAIRAMEVERQVAIRSGTCSFNGVYGRHLKLDEFLAHWSCWGQVRPTTVVVGDSHAADIAAALLSTGFDVGQMTGADCSLVPSQMTENCRRQFSHLRQIALLQPIKNLILANRYEPSELTAAAQNEMQEYWTWPGVTIWLATGLPEFPNLTVARPRAVLLGRQQALDELLPDETISRQSEAFARRFVDAVPGSRLVNSRELFCTIDARMGCRWRLNQEILLIDGHHLSGDGALRFGRRWRESVGVANGS